MCNPRARVAALALAAGLLLGADLHVWVDEEGRTHLTDDAATIPPGAGRLGEPGELTALWDGDVLGAPLRTPPGATSSDDDRTTRALAGAVEDLRRGETARATAALHHVLVREPKRPEAHFYLALLEGRRGHLDLAEAHLLAFLGAAGDRFEPWRASAKRRLQQLADERRLMESPAAGELRLVAVEHTAFRIQADAALLEAGGAEFARTAARTLEDVRALVEGALGVRPAEPMGVVLYGRPSYLRTHGSRFSFQTVGFFDGRIHVVSAAHPAGELRALLAHEYAHALFREQTGSDQPYWLNEGLAERMGRRSQQRTAVTHDERARLRSAIEQGHWLPLRRLAPNFSGLSDEQARLAYSIAAFAADWFDRHTEPRDRVRLLQLLGEGKADDEALSASIGMNTDALDAALRREVAGLLAGG